MNNFKILKNVDFDNTYTDVVSFLSKEEQDGYFNQRVVRAFQDITLTRINKTIKVTANVNELYNFNYCMFDNVIAGVTKRFYAFINEVNFVNPNSTEIVFEIDVMQTYMFDYNLKESFIEREHQERFEKKDNLLIPKLSRTLENLEIGNDYNLIESKFIFDNERKIKLAWYEVISNTEFSSGSYANTNPSTWANYSQKLTQKSLSSGFYCYIFPFIVGQKETFAQFKTIAPDGTTQAITGPTFFSTIATADQILSIRVLPYCPVKYTIDVNNLITFVNGDSVTPPAYDTTRSVRLVHINNANFKIGTYDLSKYGGYALNVRTITDNDENTSISNFVKNSLITLNNSVDFKELKNINNETKLLTHPFKYFQLTDYQSEPIKLTFENLPETIKIRFRQSLEFVTKSKYWVEGYNNDDGGKETNAINNTVNEIPLYNNAYVTYMNNNRAQATTGVAINAVAGIGMLGLGLATGGLGLVAGVGGAVSVGKGIANNLLKMQDLKSQPDNVRKSGNNIVFDLIDDNILLTLKSFEIKEQFKNVVFNYLYSYGYKVNDFKVPELKSRYYFNFIKTIGANIQGNVNTNILNKLKRIFDNGVRLWHYRSAKTFKGVFNYEFENAEVSLIEEAQLE